MEERGQGATEYLLMLAAALTATAAVAGLALETFDALGSSVNEEISEVENRLIDELSGF